MKYAEGDRVRIVAREATVEDQKSGRYYSHMSGLTGTVQNIYGEAELAVRIDPETLTKPSRDVLNSATERMRQRNISDTPQEQLKQFTKEELEFDVHYMLLLHQDDLEKA